MKNLLQRLFGSKAKAPIEQCSVEELRSIKEEADYLAFAVDATNGELNPVDMERLKRFNEKMERINKIGGRVG